MFERKLRGHAALIWLGRRFSSWDNLLPLLVGGLVGAMLIYFLTNTAAWLFNPFHNPECTRNFSGWLIALTKGTAGYPQTLEFFRNTMLSGWLWTSLFVGTVKLNEAVAEETEEEPAGNRMLLANRRKHDLMAGALH